MVSNTLGMEHDGLMTLLKRMGSEFSDNNEYTELRASLPADWPM
jgi:hypothetical protein